MFNVKEFVSSALSSKDAWTGKDKALHAAAGFLVSAVVIFVLGNPLFGVLVSALAGLGKEVYDFKTPGHEASAKDFAVTSGGGVIGAVLSLFV